MASEGGREVVSALAEECLVFCLALPELGCEEEPFLPAGGISDPWGVADTWVCSRWVRGRSLGVALVPLEAPCVVLGNNREIPHTRLGSYAGTCHHIGHRSLLLVLSRMEGIGAQNGEAVPLVLGEVVPLVLEEAVPLVLEVEGLLVRTYLREGRAGL